MLASTAILAFVKRNPTPHTVKSRALLPIANRQSPIPDPQPSTINPDALVAVRQHQCYLPSVIKPNITTKRLEEIEAIQNRLRALAKEYRNDFSEPNALDSLINKDLHAAVDSLDLLKGFYKSKTDKKA